MALGFLFLFLYLIQGLFKEHEVQSSRARPGECPWLPIHAHTFPLSGLINFEFLSPLFQ